MEFKYNIKELIEVTGGDSHLKEVFEELYKAEKEGKPFLVVATIDRKENIEGGLVVGLGTLEDRMGHLLTLRNIVDHEGQKIIKMIEEMERKLGRGKKDD